MGNGKAAMELMGQWAPGVEQAESESGQGIGDALGWFPFPELEGGTGLPTDVFGGADGFAVGKDAPTEAVDFLRYFLSEPVAERFAATNTGHLAGDRGRRGCGDRPEPHDPAREARRIRRSRSSTSTRPPRRRWVRPSTMPSRPSSPARRRAEDVSAAITAAAQSE